MTDEPKTNLERLEDIQCLIQAAHELAYDLMEESQSENVVQYADLTAVCTMLSASKESVQNCIENNDDYGMDDDEDVDTPILVIDEAPLPPGMKPTSPTCELVIECSGGLVQEVYRPNGEKLEGPEYSIIDHDSWESGECPFCMSENTDHVGGEVKLEGIYGGHMKCLDCGCDENTDVDEWLKNGKKQPS